MTPAPTRRVSLSAALAGVFAMAASLSAIGTIVISDIAEARTTQQEVLASDELPAPSKVTMKKMLAPPEPEPQEDLLLDLPMPKFGSFEGY